MRARRFPLLIAVALAAALAGGCDRTEPSEIHVALIGTGPLTLGDPLAVGSGVVREQLESSYMIACRDTPLAGSRLIIEESPLIVWCPKCRVERSLNSPQLLRWPECSAPTPKIISGRELQIVGLEIDDEQ